MSRYPDCFNRLAKRQEGALVPFTMVGDPDIEGSLAVIDALVAGGADALELGIPFSDPVADGPVIQSAHIRALAAGTTASSAFTLLGTIRSRYPDIPIGLLVYANLVHSLGLATFYEMCATVGVDSVLIPDVPIRESAPFTNAARNAGIDPVYIAPPSATQPTLDAVATATHGYVYAVSRVGVTGTDQEAETTDLPKIVAGLRTAASAPILLGFGISQPTHVRAALVAGADGAITGSAVVKIIESHVAVWEQEPTTAQVQSLQQELEAFIASMKAATHRPELVSP
ncbi:tryptophan synthase subunit alpha [Stomatohabitans albus]|uniref:tryptophan synthase subunit alpha n=1 Tax=Stomatohabitans albus TaxID=3110766 RepID=UPI00300D388C